jgi:hypothetical protein
MPREKEMVDLKGTLYTTMGTDIHSGVQTFMSLGKKFGRCVFGTWKCPKCRKIYKDQLRPELCCAVPLEYQEVDFHIGSLSGHLDLLCNYNGKWVAYEFKTNGKAMQQPKSQHVLQIRTYGAMLKACYDVDISAYTVVYIDRARLGRTIFGPYSSAKSVDQTNMWIYRAIDGYDAVSSYNRKPNRADLIKLVKLRPCKSVSDFHSYMARSYGHAGFDGDEATCKLCPLLSKCSQGDRVAFNTVTDCLGE